MNESASKEKPMPTIWRIPDELWEKIEPILAEHDPSKKTGRHRIDQRAALWRPSSSECAAAASGTAFPKNSPRTPPCTAPSSGGSS
jgi:hypothetical protein